MSIVQNDQESHVSKRGIIYKWLDRPTYGCVSFLVFFFLWRGGCVCVWVGGGGIQWLDDQMIKRVYDISTLNHTAMCNV